MSCIPGQICKCPHHQLPTKLATLNVKLQCPCGYVASARSGNAVVDALREHQAYAKCA